MSRAPKAFSVSCPPRPNQGGMTLIELMVALVIGLGVTLTVTTLLIAGENHKRTTTSTNDAEQTGAYVFNSLDGMLRGAGSGLAESAFPTPDAGVFGCKLNAGTGGGKILPRTAAFPAPFGSFLGGAPSNLRVAPLLIAKNQSPDGLSDVLAVMGGSGAAGGVSRQVTVAGTSTTVTLDNAVGFVANDLFLVSQNGTADCLLEQVNTTPTSSTLPLLTTLPYYTAGTTTTLATLSGSTASYVTPLGNAGANNNAAAYNLQFELIGVDANHTLYSYDLLKNYSLVQSPGTADAAQAIADGVYQMHAIYGIDTSGDGIQDAWAGPGLPTDANYDIATVMTSPATIRSIIAVRVALVLRGEYYDKNQVTPTTLTLFGGLTNGAGTSLQQNVSISATDRHYRYRVFEFTVPLRNMILLAGGP
jgi:type IV pilus assembly protein PilW